jgi:hypothetical protein
MKPYIDNNKIRIFEDTVDESELIWHRDEEDRIIESVENTDWQIQLDNELPKSLNREVYIKKEKWHRLIKGNGLLTLKINKIKNGKST